MTWLIEVAIRLQPVGQADRNQQNAEDDETGKARRSTAA